MTVVLCILRMTCHKKKIQGHIGQRGDSQIVKGPDAVAQCLHGGHADIIEHNGGDSAEVDPEIPQGMGENILRRVHPHQQPGNDEKTEDGCRQRSQQSKEEIGVDGLLQIILIPGAEVPGDDNAAAGGNAAEKANDQKGQIAAAAHRGKGLVAGKVADDPGIRHIVELLKNLPQKNWQREGKNAQSDASFRQ